MNLKEFSMAYGGRLKRNIPKLMCMQQGTSKDRRISSTISSARVAGREQWSSRQDRTLNTNATTTNITNSSTDDQGVIMAITEGRGEATCEVGIGAMNTQLSELSLYQISDTSSYVKVLTKINLLNPIEIIIPITMMNSRLLYALKNKFPQIKINALDRSTFRKDAGWNFIKETCALSFNSVLLMLQHKYYALSATGALKTYLEYYKRLHYAKESIKVSYNESDYNTVIDVFVADKLELVSCALGDSCSTYNKKFSSLRSILNHCVTKLGSRMLRSNILQPPNQHSEIEDRLNCVEEFIRCPEKLAAIRDILKKLGSFGQVLSLATMLKTNSQFYDLRHMNYILQLNNFFDEVEPLAELLGSCTSPFFHRVCETLESQEFRTLNAMFKQVICEDARPAFGAIGDAARCFAIRAGRCDILDLLRIKYTERLDQMKEHVDEQGRLLGYDFKLSNNTKKGYHISLQFQNKQRSKFDKKTLPSDYCQVDVMASMVTMKTIELITLANRLEDTSIEIHRASNMFVHDLLLRVQERINRFYEICEFIAKLDVLQSLAHACSAGTKYVRPKFGAYTEVIDGRHPMLDYLLEHNPVPNDIVLNSNNRFHIITGANGSGKSIYIRQIVLLQIMAQLGCYVPATKATFKICDKILARIYFEDNIECGASGFILEMKEIQYFLNVITDRTLIIIDELCRSTAVREGTALAMAICERLLNTPAFVFLTTHFTHITTLQQKHRNIKCWQMETNEEYDQTTIPKLQYTYKLLPGVVTLEHYGFSLTCSVWPRVITDVIAEIIAKLDKKMVNTAVDRRVALKINLECELQEMKRKNQLFPHTIYEKCVQYQQALEVYGIKINLTTNEQPEQNPPVESTARDSVVAMDISQESGERQINLQCESMFVDEADIHASEEVDDGYHEMVVDDDGVLIPPEVEYSNSDEDDKLSDLSPNLDNEIHAILADNMLISQEIENDASVDPAVARSVLEELNESEENNKLLELSEHIDSFISNYNRKQSQAQKDNTIPESSFIILNQKQNKNAPMSQVIDETIHGMRNCTIEHNLFADNPFGDAIADVSSRRINILPTTDNPFMCETESSTNKTKLSKSTKSVRFNIDANESNNAISECPIFGHNSTLEDDINTSLYQIDYDETNTSVDNIYHDDNNTSAGRIYPENMSSSKESQILSPLVKSGSNYCSSLGIEAIFGKSCRMVSDRNRRSPVINFPFSSRMQERAELASPKFRFKAPCDHDNIIYSGSSTSVTSSKFANGFNRENASTPLDEQINHDLNIFETNIPFIDYRNTPDKRNGSQRWTMFHNDDMEEALQLLDETIEEESITEMRTSNLGTSLKPHVITTITETTDTLATKSKTVSSSTPLNKKRRLTSSSDINSDNDRSSTDIISSTSTETKRNHLFETFDNQTESNNENQELFNDAAPKPIRAFKSVARKPLNRLTKNEIQALYDKKRMNVYDNQNTSAIEAYYNEIINRPSVKQIQASELVVSAKKMTNGEFRIEVPSPQRNTKKKLQKFKPPFKASDCFLPPFQKEIFSDKNSDVFEKFIQKEHAKYDELVNAISEGSLSRTS